MMFSKRRDEMWPGVTIFEKKRKVVWSWGDGRPEVLFWDLTLSYSHLRVRYYSQESGTASCWGVLRFRGHAEA